MTAMDDEEDGTPFWLSRWPFLEPRYPDGDWANDDD